jgi:hypothetical protein
MDEQAEEDCRGGWVDDAGHVREMRRKARLVLRDRSDGRPCLSNTACSPFRSVFKAERRDTADVGSGGARNLVFHWSDGE